jgi:enoyl-CoA hydratase
MAEEAPILIDRPAPYVQRITLNRPERRNALSNEMRGSLIEALQTADGDDEVRVSIVRGAGKCFSSGYDLKSDMSANQPYFTSNVGLQWAKHATEGWLKLWDLAKPVIAQVHGYAFAGGLELVGACDLAYATPGARLSHPVLRIAGLPDFGWFPIHMSARAAMELHIAGREFAGEEAVQAGLINQVFGDDELEERVLEIAERITQTPPGVVTVNKRYVYTALEARGARNVLRTGADLQAGPHLQSLSAEDITAQVKASNKK